MPGDGATPTSSPTSIITEKFMLTVKGIAAYKELLIYNVYSLYIMEIANLLHLRNRSELRQWLKENHNREKCCWVVTYRSKCPEWKAIPYIEVVEEALCFGWIDSTLKRLPDGRLAQRLSPRRPKSHWTQLNMDRCIDLEDRGLMTDAGRQALERTNK